MTQLSPVFSVVVPCHNASETLEETILSVLNQTAQDWELILIEDNSTDNTLALAESYAERDPRIVVLAGNQGGPSPTRNLGASFARGLVLVFLDADDTLRPASLETLRIAFTDDPNLVVSFGIVVFTDAKGNDLGRRTRISNAPLKPEDLLFGNPCGTASNIAVRRDAFRESGGFDVSLSHAEDQEWLLRMALRYPGGLVGLRTPLVNYRTGRQTLSSSLKAMDDGWSAVVERAGELAPDLIRRHGRRAAAARQRHLASRLVDAGGGAGTILRHWLGAIRSWPWLMVIEPRRTFGVVARLTLSRLSTRSHCVASSQVIPETGDQ